MSPPLPQVRPLTLVLAALLSPVWVALTCFCAVLVALFTSVHGAATVAVVLFIVPTAALTAGTLKHHQARRPPR
ncbi:hypothetical protein [Ornithinimicrobium panacihumi]|uniref:hypothetical protein n=1 Tax=Ornithinimicrobium panacihumi TaxID=2008449 RepID=UPI003F8C6DCE